jgi:hypothetical protein
VGELVAAAVGAAWFFYLGYGATLSPTDVGWMMRDDWASYYWGFAFFRNADWAFPLGDLPDLIYPIGTSVAFTDANPWMALPFRVLSPWLPAEFQYFGLWYLLCFVLQGVFGARLTRAFTSSRLQRALGGSLFVLAPILPVRNGHISLCGMFLITAALGLALRPTEDTQAAWKRVRASLLLLAWAGGTHGYLAVMVLAVSLSVYLRLWRIDRTFTAGQTALALVSALGTLLTVFVLFGYIGSRDVKLTSGGFANYASDLNAFVNSRGWSRWVPGLPSRPAQWEGFSYLGLGTGALVLLRVGLSVLSPGRSKASLGALWPLLAVVLGMQFVALSSGVSLNGRVVWNLESLYAPLETLTRIFRTSGRFTWPFHLLLVAGGISAACSLRRTNLGTALLFLAVCIQAFEFDPARLSFRTAPMNTLKHPAWQSAGNDYRHVELVPMQILWACRYERLMVARLTQLAYQQKLTINSGHAGRAPANIRSLCERHIDKSRPLAADTLYVVNKDFLADFRRNDAHCGRLDGLLLCVNSAHRTPLAQALRERPISP